MTFPRVLAGAAVGATLAVLASCHNELSTARSLVDHAVNDLVCHASDEPYDPDVRAACTAARQAAWLHQVQHDTRPPGPARARVTAAAWQACGIARDAASAAPEAVFAASFDPVLACPYVVTWREAPASDQAMIEVHALSPSGALRILEGRATVVTWLEDAGGARRMPDRGVFVRDARWTADGPWKDDLSGVLEGRRQAIDPPRSASQREQAGWDERKRRELERARETVLEFDARGNAPRPPAAR